MSGTFRIALSRRPGLLSVQEFGCSRSRGQQGGACGVPDILW